MQKKCRINETGYPLPPNEENTQILRVVVRESLSIDMIDRLVTDICHVTESMMNSDAADIAAWQPAPRSVEVRKALPTSSTVECHGKPCYSIGGIHYTKKRT